MSLSRIREIHSLSFWTSIYSKLIEGSAILNLLQDFGALIITFKLQVIFSSAIQMCICMLTIIQKMKIFKTKSKILYYVFRNAFVGRVSVAYREVHHSPCLECDALEAQTSTTNRSGWAEVEDGSCPVKKLKLKQNKAQVYFSGPKFYFTKF